MASANLCRHDGERLLQRALATSFRARNHRLFFVRGSGLRGLRSRRDRPRSIGLAVSGFESTPYNVSVGGTDFNDLTTTATYWNPTNNANQANAKGYIPEMTWNDTCTNSEVFSFFGTSSLPNKPATTSMRQEQGFLGVAGGSGGASNCTTSDGSLRKSSCYGRLRQAILAIAPGVPSDNKRDVPDVSLFASNGFNNSFYIICQSDATRPCSLSAGANSSGYGGTSVSAPAFAGIMALINQKTGERQGNANYVFYKMAATSANSCNSSSVPIHRHQYLHLL